MRYDEAVAYLSGFDRMDDKDGIGNMIAFLRRLGNPEKAYPSYHIAGTNGKGSICALIDASLRAAGRRVGLYTSPELERFSERIRIGGQPIGDDAFAEVTRDIAAVVGELRAEGIKLTFFEVVTAVALTAFMRAGVDVAVLETGMGGRLDATNAVSSNVAVISRIGLDHTHVLGDTAEKIAWEKACIIKQGRPVVVHDQPESVKVVIRAVAEERNAAYWDVKEADTRVLSSSLEAQVFSYLYGSTILPQVTIKLAGSHQIGNAATAITALIAGREYGIGASDDEIVRGFMNARWAGRLETVSARGRTLLLDGAHNPQGAAVLREAVKRHLKGRRVVLLCGIMASKDHDAMVDDFAAITREVVAVSPDARGALATGELCAEFATRGVSARAKPSVGEGLEAVIDMTSPEDVILVAGSLYLVGGVRSRLLAFSGILSEFPYVLATGERDALSLLRANGKTKTARHSEAVAQACQSLAERFGLDAGCAYQSGLLHDVAAVIKPEDMLAHAVAQGFELDEAERRYPFLLHQRFSAMIARENLGIHDASVLSAVACHTTLKPNASQLDMALFVADKLAWDQEGEPPFFADITQALRVSLRAASLAYIEYVLSHGMILCPHRLLTQARAWLKNEQTTGGRT